jgi:hypothetical protein
MVIADYSWDRQYAGYLRQTISQVSLDTVMEGHHTARAAVTGTVKSNVHCPVLQDVDQFNITAIRLNRWANQIDHFLHTVPQVRITCREALEGRGCGYGYWHNGKL